MKLYHTEITFPQACSQVVFMQGPCKAIQMATASSPWQQDLHVCKYIQNDQYSPSLQKMPPDTQGDCRVVYCISAIGYKNKLTTRKWSTFPCKSLLQGVDIVKGGQYLLIQLQTPISWCPLVWGGREHYHLLQSMTQLLLWTNTHCINLKKGGPLLRS